MKENINKDSSIEYMKPSFLILTFPKTGSTSLYETLKKHPEICLPLHKETWYFSRFYSRGDNWYHERFWHCDKYKNRKSLIGEVSTDAMLKNKFLERIKKTLPDAKIIVLLRDPIKRTISHYYHSSRVYHENRNIDEALLSKKANILSNKNECTYKYGFLIFSTRYKSSIQKLLDLYAKEKIKFILLEELIENPSKILNEIQHFIGVHSIDLPLMRTNVSRMPIKNHFLIFISQLPLLLFRKLEHISRHNNLFSSGLKHYTRKFRFSMEHFLKNISELVYKEFNKPQLDKRLKSKLVNRFNQELKELDKISGLPLSKYWTWYRSK